MIGHRSHGLGTNWVIDSSGKTIDCDSVSNIFNTACWGFGTQVGTLPNPSSAPAPAAVDCTQFWNAFTNSNCSVSGWASSTFILPVVAIAGVLLLFVVMRR